MSDIIKRAVSPVKSRKIAHYVATGQTPEGVPTTVELWYLINDVDRPDTSDYSEHMSTTYHYSEVYGEGEPDSTLNDARNVTHAEMNRTVRFATEDYGYKPFA